MLNNYLIYKKQPSFKYFYFKNQNKYFNFLKINKNQLKALSIMLIN